VTSMRGTRWACGRCWPPSSVKTLPSRSCCSTTVPVPGRTAADARSCTCWPPPRKDPSLPYPLSHASPVLRLARLLLTSHPSLPPAQAPTTVGARWVNSIQSWLVPSPSIILWQQLLTAGAHPLSADRNGVTAFHIACARGNWPAVQFLIQGSWRRCPNFGQCSLVDWDVTWHNPHCRQARGGHQQS
jgi:hypothetical protein